MNHNNDKHVMIILRAQKWNEYTGSNKHLFHWTEDTHGKREMMPGKENIADYPGLMKS